MFSNNINNNYASISNQLRLGFPKKSISIFRWFLIFLCKFYGLKDLPFNILNMRTKIPQIYQKINHS